MQNLMDIQIEVFDDRHESLMLIVLKGTFNALMFMRLCHNTLDMSGGRYIIATHGLKRTFISKTEDIVR